MRTTATILFSTLLSIAFLGCSTAAKTPRQQRVYEKYLKQRAEQRAKQQEKIRRKQPEMPPQPPVSEPVINLETEE